MVQTVNYKLSEAERFPKYEERERERERDIKKGISEGKRKEWKIELMEKNQWKIERINEEKVC